MNASRTADGDGPMADLGADFPARLASAVVLAAVALAGAWFGGWVAAVVVAAAAVVVHLEWIGLTERSPWPAAIFTGALVVAIALVSAGVPVAGFAVVGIAILAAAVGTGDPWRPLGLAYAALLGLGLIVLRLTPELGFAAIVVVFAVVWATDTGAFVAGRLIGGPRLWPKVSPNKTWAGGIAGLALGVAAGALAAAAFGVPIGAPLLAVAALLSLAAQAGDLFESRIKRLFGAKDSGRLIPGHGGLMDRVDGLTFAAGLAALVGWLNAGPAGVAAGLLQW